MAFLTMCTTRMREMASSQRLCGVGGNDDQMNECFYIFICFFFFLSLHFFFIFFLLLFCTTFSTAMNIVLDSLCCFCLYMDIIQSNEEKKLGDAIWLLLLRRMHSSRRRTPTQFRNISQRNTYEPYILSSVYRLNWLTVELCTTLNLGGASNEDRQMLRCDFVSLNGQINEFNNDKNYELWRLDSE